MKYEIVTHDGKIYEIQQDSADIIARLASKLELIPVTLNGGKIEYFSKGTVARIQTNTKPATVKPERTLQAKNEVDYRGTITKEQYAEARAKLKSKMI